MNVSKQYEVNRSIRRQAVQTSKLHKKLYPWADRLRRLVGKQTGVVLPDVAIAIEPGRWTALGWYHVGRDGLQLRGRVTVNALYIDLPFCWVLEVLCHEVLHFAEELAEKRSKATRSAYHPKWFRDHAKEIGIPCDRAGQSTSDIIHPETPFAHLLKKHGIKLELFPRPTADYIPPRSHQRTYRCRCSSIRATKKINAKCLACGVRFVEQ